MSKTDPLAKKSSIKALLKRLEQTDKIVIGLTQRVKQLERENAMLKEKLNQYKNPKNSSNSSIPPSKDENKPVKTTSGYSGAY